MKKTKEFEFARFKAEVLRGALEKCQIIESRVRARSMTVQLGREEWSHDSVEEFLADYRRTGDRSNLYAYSMPGDSSRLDVQLAVITGGSYMLHNGARSWGWNTEVSVTAPTREQIESVFAIFESALDSARKIPAPQPPPPPKQPTVFVGHGRSGAWRDLKDHLHEQHGYKVEAFETGARAGHIARDVLEEMLKNASFALLVMTPEDEQADGTMRARQNVIHEAGLFQGKLGFSRAILLLESGCEEFSNVQSVQQIRFSAGNIRETYGDVLATLRREFARASA